MTTELIDCPNCGTKLKIGILSSVTLASRNLTAIINEYHDRKADGYCSKCVGDLQSKYLSQFQRECDEVRNKLQNLIHAVPVVSTHSPLTGTMRF